MKNILFLLPCFVIAFLSGCDIENQKKTNTLNYAHKENYDEYKDKTIFVISSSPDGKVITIFFSDKTSLIIASPNQWPINVQKK